MDIIDKGELKKFSYINIILNKGNLNDVFSHKRFSEKMVS